MPDYDVIIVGGGPAGLGAAHRLRQKSNMKVLIIEKGRGPLKRTCIVQKGLQCPPNSCGPCNIMTGIGGAGGMSDGKLLLCPEIGGDLQQYFSGDKSKAYELINRLDKEIWEKYDPEPETSLKSVPEKMLELRQRARDLGMDFFASKQKHIGSDNLPKLINGFMEDLEKSGIEFKIQTSVKDLLFDRTNGTEKVSGVLLEDGTKLTAKYVILAVGRSGHGWIINLADKHKIDYIHGPIDIGVRVETSNKIMKKITDISYDQKFYIKPEPYRDNVRTFCTNPQGWVTKEDYPGKKLVGVNGHSTKGKLSENTNFALLTTINFTRPLANSHVYGERLARMAYDLGGGKVLLQRLGDMRKPTRTKQEDLDNNSIQPTLEKRNYCPASLSLFLPQRIFSNLLSAFEQLDKIIPGINGDDTLIYAPEIKYYSARFTIDENFMTNIQNLFVAGDGAGLSRDIVNSNATGWLAAQGILKLNNSQ